MAIVLTAAAVDDTDGVAPRRPTGGERVPRRTLSPTASVLMAAVFLTALPLVIDPAGWYVYLPLRWSAIVLAVGAIALLGLRTSTPRSPTRRPPHSLVVLTRWWAALLAIVLVAALASSAPRIALLGAGDRMSGAATWILHGALALVGARIVRRREHLVVLARAMCLGLVAVACVTIAQRGGWDVPAGASSFSRPGGPFGNANFLGAYCVLAILVAMGVALDRDERDPWRAVAALATLMGTAVLVVSGSRAAWLAVALGVAVLLVTSVRRDALSARAAALIVSALLVFGVGLGAVVGAGGRLEDVTGGTARGRVDTWVLAGDTVLARPVLGWGPEGFTEGFSRSVDEQWEQSYGRRLTPDRAHNGVLDVAATVGLVGLAVYLGVLLVTARGIRDVLRVDRQAVDRARGRRPNAEHPTTTSHVTVALGVACALGAYLVQQQALFPLPDVDAMAWLLAGALVGLGLHATPYESATPGTAAAAHARGRSLVAAVGVVAVVACSWVGVSAVRADRHARVAADALGRGDAADAYEAAEASLGLEPGQVLVTLLLSDAAIASGDPATVRRTADEVGAQRGGAFDDGRLTLAEARLRLALGTSDDDALAASLLHSLLRHDPARGEAWLMLGEVEDRLGDTPAAIAAWERAAQLQPDSLTARMRLLDAAVADGRLVDARVLLDEMERIGPPTSSAGQMELMALRAQVDAASTPATSGTQG